MDEETESRQGKRAIDRNIFRDNEMTSIDSAAIIKTVQPSSFQFKSTNFVQSQRRNEMLRLHILLWKQMDNYLEVLSTILDNMDCGALQTHAVR
jgi:hypothetical protein